jgi:hypothetical protein
MKLKITLSQTPMLPPITREAILPITDIDKTYSITYNLTENCNTTDKFIDLCTHALHTSIYWCGYNIYKDIDRDTYIFLLNRMNSIIEIINATDEVPDIDISLILDVTSIIPQNSKLNELHLYFEQTKKDGEYDNRISLLLEEINQIVHTLEGGGDTTHREIGGEGFGFQSAIRLASLPGSISKTLPLTDEDYGNFTTEHQWGDLLLDYYRVGKDLHNAATTNDINLVTTRGLCQQNTIHPCVFLNFHFEPPEYQTEFYYKWCEVHNVRDYYDIDLPMFALGKVVLGKIDMTGTTLEEVSKELSKCSGITTVELIDE